MLGRSASSYWASDEGVVDVGEQAATDDEDAGERTSAQKKIGKAAATALALAAIAAFAYSDASVSFPVLGPAQTLARSFVDLIAAGADYLVDVALDAYDACILGAINAFAWFQSLLLAPGNVIAKSAAAAAPVAAKPNAIVNSLLGLLCAKPFMSIAAVLLTLSRIVVSWGLAAAEYACALLYATPVYVAVPSAAAMYFIYKNRKANAPAKVAAPVPVREVLTRRAQAAPAPIVEEIDVASSAATSAKWDIDYSSSSSMSSSSMSSMSSASYASYSSSTASAKSYDFEGGYSNSEASMGSYGVDQAEIERIYRELMPNLDDVYGTATKTMPVVTAAAPAKEQPKAVPPPPAKAVATSVLKETPAPAPPKAAAPPAPKAVTPPPAPKAVTPPPPPTPVAPTPTTSAPAAVETSITGGKTVKKGGSKEAFYNFVNKVSSIKTDDVLKVATETASKVATKENLDKVASVATEVVSKVTSSFDESTSSSSSRTASSSVAKGGKVTLPQGTRKVSDSSEDDDGNLSEGTVIKKKA